jgi:hypothetical protein
MSDLTDPESYLYAKTTAVLAAQGMEGIGGWMFDIPMGESIDLDADITDHYVENGSFITDHIVLKPIIITLRGYKGELIYTAPKKNTLTGILNNATSLLGAVPAYFGPLTPGAATKITTIANQAAYIASQAQAIAKRGSNLIKYFSGEDDSANLQQKAFIELQALWNSKQIMTVQTPWGFYKNMAIQHVTPKQDENSNDYTDFSVTLKEMRFADVKITTFDSGSYIDAQKIQKAEAAKNAQAGQTDLGQGFAKAAIAPNTPSLDSTGKLIPGANGAIK